MELASLQSSRSTADQAQQVGAEDHILRLYQELLQRNPAAEELADWVGVLCGGMSPDHVRAAFLASQEYQEKSHAAELEATVAASALFDAEWYLAAYPDVASAGLDPLRHYCRFGMLEDRWPNRYFDPLWYRKHHAIPGDALPLLDYTGRGEALGLAPGPDFDPVWYAMVHGLEAGLAPLAHFLQHRHNGRVAPAPHLWSVPALAAATAAPAVDPFQPFLGGTTPMERASADVSLLRASGLFDENYYLIIHSDVLESGLDPLVHYCAFGWREQRNPNLYFNGTWYMATNQEVTALSVNPLVHYLLIGESANRRPVAFFEPAWYRQTYQLPANTSPLAHYMAHRRTQRFSPNSLFDPAYYLSHAPEKLPSQRDPFAHYLIAGMHDDVRPSSAFDAASWRRRTTGRLTRHFRHEQYPERDNPLVNFLLSNYK